MTKHLVGSVFMFNYPVICQLEMKISCALGYACGSAAHSCMMGWEIALGLWGQIDSGVGLALIPAMWFFSPLCLGFFNGKAESSGWR